MFDIAVFVLLLVFAYRVNQVLRREQRVLREFNLRRNVGLFALLFPVGPCILLALTFVAPFPTAHIAAAACFVPGLLLARSQTRTLDSAGTDRVREVQGALSEAFVAALIGLGYVVVSFALAYGVRSLSTVG